MLRRPGLRAAGALALVILLALPARAQDAPAPSSPAPNSPAPASPAAADAMHFGRIKPADGTGPSWRPLLDGLAAQGAPPLEETTFASADAALEAIRFDRVDIAVLSPAIAVDAVARAGGQVLAALVPVTAEGDRHSVLVTGEDGPVTLAEALRCDKTRRIALGTGNSVLMNTVPGYFLFARNAVVPRTCFRGTDAGRASSNLDALAAGKVDLALATDGILRDFQAANPRDGASLRVLWQSPALPPDVLVWRTDLDPARRNALFYALFTYGRTGTPEEVAAAAKVLQALGIARLELAGDRILLPLQQTELYTRRQQVADDDSLSDEQRQSRTAELDDRLRDLQALEGQSAPPH